jgi:acetylornithine deacetylase
VRARARDGDVVALTQVLVSIPSVNPSLERGGQGEARVAAYCARRLAEWGFEVAIPEVEAGRFNVLARHHGRSEAAGPTLLFNGHLDTVGVEGMSVPPFEGRLVEGRVVGRGACDMKAGVATLMVAARRVARRGHAGELVVALTCDEEHASVGMAALVEGGLRADAAVVCEPTELAVMPAHKGFVWYEVTFQGRAAHGSRPDVGIDAILHAARFLVELDELDRSLATGAGHPLLGRGSLHAGTIAGGSAPSVYPGRCVVTLERRTLPGESPVSARAALEAALARTGAALPGLDAHIDETLVRPGTEVSGAHALVRGLIEALALHGLPDRVEGMSAWVDAAFLNESGTPAVCFGPGSIARAHAADEWVEADQIERCTDVLTDFAARFLAVR